MSTWIRRLREAHKFFCHRSQWYVLGNWYEYCAPDAQKKYRRGFPMAYLRFMGYTIRDQMRYIRRPEEGQK